MNKLEERILEVLKQNMEETDIPVETVSDLREELQLDSLGLLMIIHGLEQEFAISIDQSDFSGIHTVKDLSDYLQKNYGVK